MNAHVCLLAGPYKHREQKLKHKHAWRVLSICRQELVFFTLVGDIRRLVLQAGASFRRCAHAAAGPPVPTPVLPEGDGDGTSIRPGKQPGLNKHYEHL